MQSRFQTRLAIRLAFLLAFTLILFVAGSMYYIRTALIENTTNAIIEEISTTSDAQNDLLTYAANNWINITSSLAATVEENDFLSSSESLSDFADMVNYEGSETTFWFVAEDGTAYDGSSTSMDFSGYSAIYLAFEGENALDVYECNGENEVFSFSPVYNEDGDVHCLIAYSFRLDFLLNIFIDESEHSTKTRLSDFCLLASDGTVIVATDGAPASEGENFYETDFFLNSNLWEATGIKKEEIIAHNSGLLPYEKNEDDAAGDELVFSDSDSGYVSYMYNETTGWTIVSLVDAEALSEFSTEISNSTSTLYYIAATIIFFVFLTLGIILFFCVRSLRVQGNLMEIDQERFLTLSKYLDSNVFYYRVPTDELRLTDETTEYLDAIKSALRREIQDFLKHSSEEEDTMKSDIQVVLNEEETLWYRISCMIQYHNGEAFEVTGRIENVDNEKSYSIELEKRTQLDPMTHLFNKEYFSELVDWYLTNRPNDHHAFFFVDVDNFKYFNDTYGHDMGDQVLVAVSENIKSCFRDKDLVGRFGGDEFVVLAVSYKEDTDLADIAKRLIKKITSISLEGMNDAITISIGIAKYPEDGSTQDALSAAADRALYQSKHNGKNRYSFPIDN